MGQRAVNKRRNSIGGARKAVRDGAREVGAREAVKNKRNTGGAREAVNNRGNIIRGGHEGC